MKILKYAGLCAAGFSVEFFVSALFAFMAFALLGVIPLYLVIAAAICIPVGMMHEGLLKRIYRLGLSPVFYYITAMALPLLLGNVGSFLIIFFPELFSREDGDFGGLLWIVYLAVLGLNTFLSTACGVFFHYRGLKYERQDRTADKQH